MTSVADFSLVLLPDGAGMVLEMDKMGNTSDKIIRG
jgi:hypothetical protein